jgi:hypothetical protein
MTADIDTKNSNSLLFIAGDILIKVYYLHKSGEFFSYYIDLEGLLPMKQNDVKRMSQIIYDNLPKSDIDVKIRYSCHTSRKKKNQIIDLTQRKEGVGMSYNNVLKCLKLIS